MDDAAFRAHIERLQRDLAVLECCQALARDDAGTVYDMDGERYHRVVPYGRNVKPIYVNEDLSKYVDDPDKVAWFDTLRHQWWHEEPAKLRHEIQAEIHARQRGYKRKRNEEDHIYY